MQKVSWKDYTKPLVPQLQLTRGLFHSLLTLALDTYLCKVSSNMLAMKERTDSLMNLRTSEGWASNRVSLNNDICRPSHCFADEHTAC